MPCRLEALRRRWTRSRRHLVRATRVRGRDARDACARGGKDESEAEENGDEAQQRPSSGWASGVPTQTNEDFGAPQQTEKHHQDMKKPADRVDEWLHEAYGFRDLKGESTERLKKLASTVLKRCPVRMRHASVGASTRAVARRARRVWQPEV